MEAQFWAITALVTSIIATIAFWVLEWNGGVSQNNSTIIGWSIVSIALVMTDVAIATAVWFSFR